MTVFRHELRQGRLSLAVWTGAIGLLLAVCVFLFPGMKDEMGEVGTAFSAMGSFTAAFGMDQVDFGTFLGFYAVECGSVLGLGGAFFSALTAVSILSREEQEHTADFLLTHPISRGRVVTEKLAAALGQIVLLNAVVLGLSVASVCLIGETPEWRRLLLLHLACLLMQLEIGAVCFGISAFLRRGSAGVGLGTAMLLYLLNLLANLTPRAEFLKYITPFGYAEGADIVSSGGLDAVLLLFGAGYTAAGIAAAYLRYLNKDIR